MRSAKSSTAKGYARKNHGRTATGNFRTYRITGTWPAPRPGARYEAADKRAARKIGREWAAAGAVVVIEEHQEYGVYRLVQTIDGPALAAARAAAEKAEREAAEARQKAALAAAAAARRAAQQAARDRAQATALMRQPAHVLPAAQQRARHTAGGRP